MIFHESASEEILIESYHKYISVIHAFLFIKIYSIRILRLEFVKNLRIILRIFKAQTKDDSLAKTNKLSKRYQNSFKNINFSFERHFQTLPSH